MSEAQQQTEEAPKQDATGTLVDQSKTATEEAPKPESKPEEKPGEAAKPEAKPGEAKPEDKSLLNEKDKGEAKGAPEKYEDFKAPEGVELDKAKIAEALPVFKELGLSQAGAQKLVDLYAKTSQEAANASVEVWKDTQKQWRDQIAADPELGGKLDQVRTTVSKAIDGLGDAKLAGEFREAMDYTGAGNNPAFIRAFYRLAQKVTEGTHVAGGGPAKTGQGDTGSRPSPASSMYPNLTK